jgi:hypothetical protein
VTTIDYATAGIGRWLIARAERRARVRQRVGAVSWSRVLRAVLQLAGLGWLDLAAWTLGRTVGYVAIGLTFILVAAMITGTDGERR